MAKKKGFFISFFEALAHLNPDFIGRNQNQNIEKRQANVRKMENERQARAKERLRNQEERRNK